MKHDDTRVLKATTHTCTNCLLALTTKSSLMRHLETCPVRKSTKIPNVSFVSPNVSFSEENVSFVSPNVSFGEGNVSFVSPNVSSTVEQSNTESILCEFNKNMSELSCACCKKVFRHRSSKSRHQQLCQGKNNSNLHIEQTIVHGQFIKSQTNIGNQIIINNFGNENMSHLTPQFIERCIRNAVSHGVPDMVRKIHFDPEVPENKNIRVASLRREHLGVFQEDKWMIKDKTEVIDDMINKVCIVLRQYYNGKEGQRIKDEDETQNNQFYVYKLVNIMNKIPLTYNPLRKKIFAMIVNFCKLLDEVV